MSLGTDIPCTRDLSRIIEPLASRCAKFRFKPLDPVHTKQRIEFIAEQEHVQMQDGVPPNPTFDETYGRWSTHLFKPPKETYEKRLHTFKLQRDYSLPHRPRMTM